MFDMTLPSSGVVYEDPATAGHLQPATVRTTLVVIKQTMTHRWHFFNKHLPKEEGGGQSF